MRALVLLLASACAPPLRDAVVHGAKTRVDPVADLAPVWQIDESVANVWVDRGRLVILVNGDNGARPLRWIDQRDGYESPRLASDELTFASESVIDGLRLAFMSLRTKQITVIDRPRERDETVAVRWAQPLGRDPLVGPLAIDGERVYAAFFADVKTDLRELIALSAETGVVRWRRELPDRFVARRLAGAPAPIVAGYVDHRSPTPRESFAFGLDPDTGTTTWSYRGPSSLEIAVEPERIVFARAGTLVLIDRKTGGTREVRTPDLTDGTRPEIAIRDDIAYVASWLPGSDAAVAFAIGLADGRARWRRTLPTTTDVLVTARAVYFLTTGGVLHALDRDTGKPVWEWSVGNPSHVRLVAGGDGDERIFVLGARTITAFAALAPPPPFEDAVFRGRVVIGCGNPATKRFEIGDTEVTPRHSGEFEARLHARGTVYVHPPGVGLSELDVELTGRREYRLGILEENDCNGP